MKVLLWSGSLRARSSNRALLEAFALLLSPQVQASFYDGAGKLPHFNPDDDGPTVAKEVTDLREWVSRADLLVFSTPEYAHGLPGSLKNALDWLVSDPRVAGKFAMILAADRGSRWAVDGLLEVLRTMAFALDEHSVFFIRLGTNLVDAPGLLRHPEVQPQLQIAVRHAESKFVPRA